MSRQAGNQRRSRVQRKRLEAGIIYKTIVGQSDNSEVQRAICFNGGPEIDCEHPHGVVLPVTPAPGDPTPSSASAGTSHICILHIHMQIDFN